MSAGIVPAELLPWFPVARLAAVGTIYTIGVASCVVCGAAVALYDDGDDRHLRRHIAWHREQGSWEPSS